MRIHSLFCMDLWLGILLTNYVIIRVVAKEPGSSCGRNRSNIATTGGYINRKKVRNDRKVLATYSENSFLQPVNTKEMKVNFRVPIEQETFPTVGTTLTPKPSRDDSSTKPEFEKIIIGPLMVLAEKIAFGNYLEVLRLGKQMTPDKAGAASGYVGLHRRLVQEAGFLAAFYKGFYPWGLLECMKGIPILFVQSEAIKQLMLNFHFSREKAENWSGFIGGASQAFFVCPLQKLKVSVVGSKYLFELPPSDVLYWIVKNEGLLALFNGLGPTIIRRSLDWGIRFRASATMKRILLARNNQKLRQEAQRKHEKMPLYVVDELSLFEMIVCGIFGGAISAITHPLDNVITNCQMPLPAGIERSFLAVVKRMYEEGGKYAFVSGFLFKVLENAYHTAWMYGVGSVLYDRIKNSTS